MQKISSSESSQSEGEDVVSTEKLDSEKMKQIHKRIRKILQPKYKLKKKIQNKKKLRSPDFDPPNSQISEKKEEKITDFHQNILNFPSASQNPGIKYEYEKKKISDLNPIMDVTFFNPLLS